jgi:tetratricopeptide (TPR) repeat protein
VLWQLGDYESARAALDEALNAARSPDSSYKELLAFIHLSYARMALSELNYQAARDSGKESLALAGNQQEVSIEAKYTLGLAHLRSGSKLEGKQLCEEAAAAAARTSESRLLPSAQLALAEVLLGTGETGRALDTAVQAHASFARIGQQDSEWRALLFAAMASRSAGDHSKAQEYSTRAAAVLLALQQKWGAAIYDKYQQRPDVQYFRKQLDAMLIVKE